MDNLFWDELFKHLKPYLNKSKSKRVQRNVLFGLAGLNDKIKPSRQKITPIEEYLSSLLFNYSELDESLKRFKIISILIKQYPKLASWDKVGLTKTIYLRYHYETFLSEAYLYRERMKLFLNTLKKQCKQKGLSKEAEYVEKVLKDFLDSLEGVNNVRGRHVHVRRFKNNKIEQLTGLELVLDSFDHLKELRDQEYKNLRSKLSKEVDRFGTDLEELQNITLSKILKLTFTDLKKKYD